MDCWPVCQCKSSLFTPLWVLGISSAQHDQLISWLATAAWSHVSFLQKLTLLQLSIIWLLLFFLFFSQTPCGLHPRSLNRLPTLKLIGLQQCLLKSDWGLTPLLVSRSSTYCLHGDIAEVNKWVREGGGGETGRITLVWLGCHNTAPANKQSCSVFAKL